MRPAFERLRLPAQIGSVRLFCDFARQVAAGAGFTAEDLDRLELVIEEIVVNIARYGYDREATGEAELACAVEGPRRLRLEVSDNGREFDPLASSPPDFSRGMADRPPGGLGIFLVRSIAESITWQRDGNRNVLAFTFTAA
jgi:serine/threonine-protein kinase RsbW